MYLDFECCTALVTPFDKDKKIDFNNLGKLIDFQIKGGIKAILICGTTGEASTLKDEEHLEVIRFARKRIGKRAYLIAGCGSNDTSHAVYMTKEAERIGADAVLLVTPYYNKCSQKGAYLHYEKIAKNTRLPCIIYNVPSRTGFDISAETVGMLSDIKNIVGIKEASSSVEKIGALRKKCREDFLIYTGNDSMTCDAVKMGADGVISVVSNIVPKIWGNLASSLIKGEGGDEVFKKYQRLCTLLFKDVNPIPVKACLYLMGMIDLSYRLPLCPPDESLMKELKAELIEKGLI